MYFGEYSIEPVKDAATVQRLCENCKNVTDHVLVDQPSGIAFGIPFMKRPLWSSHKAYALVCPICTWGTPVSKDEAGALIRRGQGHQ